MPFYVLGVDVKIDFYLYPWSVEIRIFVPVQGFQLLYAMLIGLLILWGYIIAINVLTGNLSFFNFTVDFLRIIGLELFQDFAIRYG